MSFCGRAIVAATWNVRSLVERAGGDRRICRSRPERQGGHGDRRICRSRPERQAQEVLNVVDRKLDFMMKELRRYRVSVAAVQETKWFGKDVWEAQGYTFLHSGRPLPSEEGIVVRNEGVGIALDERATAAWKEAGEVWNAVGSLIVTARLKATSVGQRRPGSCRETRNIYISIISVYAPTAKAPPNVMQKFMDDLQDTVDKISPLDVLILLGDFNARVGRREDDHLWFGVHGKHGIGQCNDAGERFLEFCARNQFTIMNTWFEKKQHHLGYVETPSN